MQSFFAPSEPCCAAPRSETVTLIRTIARDVGEHLPETEPRFSRT
jgi:hypothetical protein